jgi:hypothetical protein
MLRPVAATYRRHVVASNRRFFLVERYAPAAHAESIAAAMQRLTEAPDGTRHICTVLVLADEFCLSVFEAPDAAAVAEINSRAGLPADRIVAAEWFPGR